MNMSRTSSRTSLNQLDKEGSMMKLLSLLKFILSPRKIQSISEKKSGESSETSTWPNDKRWIWMRGVIKYWSSLKEKGITAERFQLES